MRVGGRDIDRPAQVRYYIPVAVKVKTYRMGFAYIGVSAVHDVVFHEDNVIDHIVHISVIDLRTAGYLTAVVIGISQRHVMSLLTLQVRITVRNLAGSHHVDVWIESPQTWTRDTHLVSGAQA